MEQLDPRLFGGTEPRQEIPLPELPVEGQVDATPINPAAIFQGTQAVAQGAAMRAEGDREKAGFIEAVGAGLSTGLTARILDAVNKPHFGPADPSFKLSTALNSLDFVPTDEELTYLQGTVKNPESWDWASELIRRRRDAQQASGDNIFGAILGMAVDPAEMALTPLGGRLASIAKAGRLAGAGAAGAGAGALYMAGEGPRSTTELASYVLGNALGGFMTTRNGARVAVDPDLPVDDAVRVLEQTAGGVPAIRMRPDGIPEPIPAALAPRTAAAPDAVQDAVDSEVRSWSKRIGEGLQWNLQRTLQGFGEGGKRFGKLMFDDNMDLSAHSAESHKALIRTELQSIENHYHDAIREEMANRGAGLWRQVVSPKRSAQIQKQIEEELAIEMQRREMAFDRGVPYEGTTNPTIRRMADSLDAAHARAADELKAAGVEGAEAIQKIKGWYHRKWSSAGLDDMEQSLVRQGMTQAQAARFAHRLLQTSLTRRGMDVEVAGDVASATLDRVRRKGEHLDSGMAARQDSATMAEMRDYLNRTLNDPRRVQRAMDILEASSDEAGKAGFMKHRIKLDYDTTLSHGGREYSIRELLDNRMTTNVNQYLDGVAAQAALARKGLTRRSDIQRMKADFMSDIPVAKRAEAEELFDNSMNHFMGLPSGQQMNKTMRLMGAYNRMIALGNSGLWQLTEYANIMGKYGALKTIKYAMKTAPGFKQLFNDVQASPALGRQLKDILADHSKNQMRLKPYLQRFEDNFEIGAEDTLQLAAQQAGQLVPYANLMKFVHSHQANIASNLIVDRLRMAATGDKGARDMLKKYGIESQVMDRLKASIDAHGFNVDKWSDGVWQQVRPAFGKMMDEAVLHSRMGDMPAFAQFDNVGKFLFMYRSFMLTAHNKILAGTLARDGAAPLAAIMAYQYPLTAMAVAASNSSKGKKTTAEDAAVAALGQMGALGGVTELLGILSGQKNSATTPGLIPIDRGMQFLSGAASGDFGKAGSAAVGLAPVIGTTMAARILQTHMKD